MSLFDVRMIARNEIRIVGPFASFKCPANGGHGCSWCFPPFCLLRRLELEKCVTLGACEEEVYQHTFYSYDILVSTLNIEELCLEARECIVDMETRHLNTGPANDLDSIYSSLNSSALTVAQTCLRRLGEEEHNLEKEEVRKKLPPEVLAALEKLERIKKERKENATRRAVETRQSQGQGGKEREII